MAVVLDTEKNTLDLYRAAWRERERATMDVREPLFIDVGANVGEWADAARARFPRAPIVCFEPQKGAFAKLVEKARSDDRLAAVDCGLSSKPMQAVLHATHHDDSVLATLVDRPDRHAYHGTNTRLDREERALFTTLDCWIDEERLPIPDFMKIDVEGHEYDVMLGAACLLGLHGGGPSIGVIQWEFNDCSMFAGRTLGDFAALLATAYRIYVEANEGLTPVTNFAYRGDPRETLNYVAVHRSIDWFPGGSAA